MWKHSGIGPVARDSRASLRKIFQPRRAIFRRLPHRANIARRAHQPAAGRHYQYLTERVCACHAVRAPGSEVTRPPDARDGMFGLNRGSQYVRTGIVFGWSPAGRLRTAPRNADRPRWRDLPSRVSRSMLV